MTREEFVDWAESQGWKAWGKLKDRSPDYWEKYQCYRKGRVYCWIAGSSVARSDSTVSVDFERDPAGAKMMLTRGW